MAKSKAEQLPTGSISDLVDFFETHDMGDYLDHMAEVDFEIDIKKRTHLVAVAEDLLGKITDLARSKHISSEALINSILREKIAEAT